MCKLHGLLTKHQVTSHISPTVRQEVTPAGCGGGRGRVVQGTATLHCTGTARLVVAGWSPAPHNVTTTTLHHLRPATSRQFLDPARLSMFVPGLARDRKLSQPSLVYLGNIVFTLELRKYFQLETLEVSKVG